MFEINKSRTYLGGNSKLTVDVLMDDRSVVLMTSGQGVLQCTLHSPAHVS